MVNITCACLLTNKKTYAPTVSISSRMVRKPPLTNYGPSDLDYQNGINELTIIGKDELATIEVSLDGTFDVEENSDIDKDIIISDKAAEVTLEKDIVTLSFDGELSEIIFFQGDAELHLNDQEIQ